jgi:hypothetical protein
MQDKHTQKKRRMEEKKDNQKREYQERKRIKKKRKYKIKHRPTTPISTHKPPDATSIASSASYGHVE